MLGFVFICGWIYFTFVLRRSNLHSNIGYALEALGQFFVLLAILPTDHLFIRSVLLCTASWEIFQTVGLFSKHLLPVLTAQDCIGAIPWSSDPPAWGCLGIRIFFVFIFTFRVLYVCTCLLLLSFKGRKALDGLWMASGIFLLAKVCVLPIKIALSDDLHDLLYFAPNVICKICVGLAFVLPSFRERAQAFLARQGHEVNVAGLIAGFIGGDADAGRVIKESKQLFRYICFEDITVEDMIAAKAGACCDAAFKRSQPALAGQVDAFVSHSWHDDPHAKWDKLKAWCERFKATHGRQPKLWFDFCCIDQSNIQPHLRCLPVYLSGCRKLLVIAGTTYIERLWCLIELFVFVSIHGAKAGEGRLEVQYINTPMESDVTSVGETYKNFDARNCKCSDPGDKQRILDIIEAGSGTMGRFNAQVRGMLSTFQEEV